MSGDGWIKTSKERPPDGLAVETVSIRGEFQILTRIQNMYYHEDLITYVEYIPAKWRRKVEINAD